MNTEPNPFIPLEQTEMLIDDRIHDHDKRTKIYSGDYIQVKKRVIAQSKGAYGPTRGIAPSSLIDKIREAAGDLIQVGMTIHGDGYGDATYLTATGWRRMTEEELAARAELRDWLQRRNEAFHRRTEQQQYDRYLELKAQFEPEEEN